MNYQRLVFVLTALADPRLFAVNMVPAIFPLVYHEDGEVRKKAFDLVKDHLTTQHMEIENCGKLGGVLNFYILLGFVGGTLEALFLMTFLKPENFLIMLTIHTKMLKISVSIKNTQLSPTKFDEYIRQNEEILVQSGSQGVGECASFVDLYHKMGLTEETEEILYTDEYSDQLSQYAKTLIVSLN